MVTGRLRVVFFGTPEFAVPTLEALLGSRHAVVGVVTQPDRPRGRGQRTTDSPVKTRALAAGIPIFQPRALRDSAFMDPLAGLGADIGVVAAYGRILPDAVLAVPRLGMINVHASLLPRYRGAAPIHRAVIAGEAETGVTIMRVVTALDAGPMLANVARAIGTEETSEDVEFDLAGLGASLLVDTLDRMTAEGVPELPQNDAAASYAQRLTKEDGVVDWSRSADELHNLIRGLHPWPHAFSFLNGERIILLKSRALSSGTDAGTPPSAPPEPGTIVAAHGDVLAVQTGRGALALDVVQREGRRPATAREFMSGGAVRPGDRFSARP
jgi:methionyl-tRNA formyltransferase